MTSWYKAKPAGGDGVCISTRVRLARNLAAYPFSQRLSDEARDEINEKVREAIFQGNSALAEQLRYIDMSKISDVEAIGMVERHIISPGFAKERAHRALLVSKDETISIMLGEEDHIRIQVLYAGLALEAAFDMADKIDTLIGERLDVAFDETLGFLTECPTNIGTGMRASVMLHLPALENNGLMRQMGETVSKVGFTVRGIYGEGSDAAASLYQLSNQVTLGITEQAALENLRSITAQVVAKESEERGKLDRLSLEDAVWRAYGTLCYARRMDSAELMGLLSKLKLGIEMGILKGIDQTLPVQMLIEAQPAMLELKTGTGSVHQRDMRRADALREALKRSDRL